MSDLTWIDIFKSIPFEKWILAIEHSSFKHSSSSLFRFFTINHEDYSLKGINYRYYSSYKTLKIRDLCATNTTSINNPLIKFSKVSVTWDDFTYKTVKPNGSIDYQKLMIDYDPLRFEFFKHPIDKINIVTMEA